MTSKILQHPNFDIAAFDLALARLRVRDVHLARIVELKCLVGFSNEEIAKILKTDPHSVRSDWAKAKLWLARVLKIGMS